MSGRKRRRSSEDGEDQENRRPPVNQATVPRRQPMERSTGDRTWEKYPGMIIRVAMKNFMCHAELTYEPTERLNFLHGANGSGKSAVLSAIVFALGGSAATSNRGKSNKGLIRAGSDSATVEVTLWNKGDEAYRPEVFGDSITVARTVSQSSGTYRLKDHRRTVVVDKKVREELDRILETFSIQVDNPIAILNQDAAKTFLFKCDEYKLYEFFMRATQMDSLMEQYNNAANEKAAAEENVKTRQEGMAKLKKDKEMWEKKMKMLASVEQKKDKFKEIKRELCWTMVNEYSKALSFEEAKVVELRAKIEEIDRRLENENDSTYREQKTEVEDQVQMLLEEARVREEEVNELQKEVKTWKLQRRELEQKRATMEQKMTTKTCELSTIEEEISKVKCVDEGEVRQRAQNRADELQRLDEEVKQKEATENSTFQHGRNVQKTLDDLDQAKRAQMSAQNRHEGNIQKCQVEINGYKRQGSNKVQLFGGNNVPVLLQAIERAKKSFKTMPLGPLGQYVELAPNVGDEAAKLIDKELGQVFNSFLVSNFEDKVKLQKIARECKMDNITIITTEFQHKVYDVSGGRCYHDKFRTIMDCIVVNNPVVMNCLIDQKSIERVLIIDSDRDAMQILKDQRTVPKNLLFAYTLQFNQYYPAPSYRSYAVTGQLRSRLQSSVDDMITSLENEISEEKVKLAQVKEEVAKIKKEIKEHTDSKNKGENIIRQLKADVKRMKAQMQKLNQEAEEDKSPDISALEEDRDRVAEELEEMQNKKDKMDARISENLDEEKRAAANVSEKRKVWQETLGRHEPLKKKLEALDADHKQLSERKAKLQRKKSEFQNKSEEVAKAVEEARERLNFTMGKANKFNPDGCPYPADYKYKRAEAVRREVELLKESLRRAEESQDDPEVVRAKYQETQIQFATHMMSLEELQTLIKMADINLCMRRKGFLTMRGSICRMTANNFSIRLSTRKYYGKLVFDHKEKTLQIMVNPNANVQNTQGADSDDEAMESGIRDIKTLSGGEKSFCTVSLVLSLWEDMYPPFRILDEFDVFMDSINRKMAIDLITNYASESRKFQYMFLTPLSLEHLKDKKEDVEVVYFEKNQG